MTAKVEDKILNAFDAIYSLDVIYGDVRADNILIAGDDNFVWIIDFEYAEIVEERDSSKKSKFLRRLK